MTGINHFVTLAQPLQLSKLQNLNVITINQILSGELPEQTHGEGARVPLLYSGQHF